MQSGYYQVRMRPVAAATKYYSQKPVCFIDVLLPKVQDSISSCPVVPSLSPFWPSIDPKNRSHLLDMFPSNGPNGASVIPRIRWRENLCCRFRLVRKNGKTGRGVTSRGLSISSFCTSLSNSARSSWPWHSYYWQPSGPCGWNFFGGFTWFHY